MDDQYGVLSVKLRELREASRMTLTELAAFSHFTKAHLSNVEAGRRKPTLEVLMAYERLGLDRRSFLTRSAALTLELVSGVVHGRPASAQADPAPDLQPISAAFGSYANWGSTAPAAMDLREVDRLVGDVHRRYQAADYVGASEALPALVSSVDAAAFESDSHGLAAFESQCRVYTVAAKLLTKVGDPHLAWMAADRAANAALKANNPMLTAASAYQVTCALLRVGQPGAAERVAVRSAEAVTERSPLGLSLRGALTLVAAVIAGRRDDRSTAASRLADARILAERLGVDANHGWTAFGPTNVQIHNVSIAAELGDPAEVLARAEGLTTDSLLPGLRSRRVQLHIDSAWACVQQRHFEAATFNLLRAEQVAPQAVLYNPVVHDLLQGLLKQERGEAQGLRALAGRAGVLA